MYSKFIPIHIYLSINISIQICTYIHISKLLFWIQGPATSKKPPSQADAGIAAFLCHATSILRRCMTQKSTDACVTFRDFEGCATICLLPATKSR